MAAGDEGVSQMLESLDQEGRVYLAKLAEQAERYDDMVKAMKSVTQTAEKDLGDEERNLLSVAYKNVVGAKRSAWRILSSIGLKCESEPKKHTSAKNYRQTVEKELKEKCNEVLQLIDNHLLSKAGEKDEAKVFYQKMKGDYHRYLVEIAPQDSEERKEKAEQSKDAYEKARVAGKDLPNTHPIKLGLFLNYSVFHYEIQGSQEEACKLAKEAFDNAITELDNVEDDSYKDSTLIMQLLRDNLTLWQSDRENEDGGEDVEGAD